MYNCVVSNKGDMPIKIAWQTCSGPEDWYYVHSVLAWGEMSWSHPFTIEYIIKVSKSWHNSQA